MTLLVRFLGTLPPKSRQATLPSVSRASLLRSGRRAVEGVETHPMSPCFPARRKELLAWLVFLLALVAPAHGVVHPRMLDWQARLSRMIPESARIEAARVADGLTVTSAPQDLRQALLSVAPTLPRQALELYAGIRVLQRREEVLLRFGERLKLLEESLDLLDRYRREIHQTMRLAPRGPVGPALEFPGEGLPTPEVHPDGVHVLRFLPSPRPGTPRSSLRLFLQAAEEDTHQLQSQNTRTLQARDEFLEGTLLWRQHLYRLANLLDPATGLPFPSQSQPQNPPWVEQIPPPPPLDLPEFQESEPGQRP